MGAYEENPLSALLIYSGAYRTKTRAQQQRRLEFIERLSGDVPVHAVTLVQKLFGQVAFLRRLSASREVP